MSRSGICWAGWIRLALALGLLSSPQVTLAKTLTVAGVVTEKATGGRYGGARVALVNQAGGKPWAQDTTSDTGVYTLVASNIVGNAPLSLSVVYLGNGTDRVAGPVTITVHPDRPDLMIEKPHDLELLSVQGATYDVTEATELLAAMAHTSEKLQLVEEINPQELTYLSTTALAVHHASASGLAQDPKTADLNHLLGRVEVSAAVAAAADENQINRILEQRGLAGRVELVRGVPSGAALKLFEGNAELLMAHPSFEIELATPPDWDPTQISLEMARLGIDPARVSKKHLPNLEDGAKLSVRVKAAKPPS